MSNHKNYKMTEILTHKNLEYSIKIIDSKETYSVRHPILRKGKPLESCIFDGDDLETTFHLGLFSEEKLIGICTFLKKKYNVLSETHQYQLRGMAILNDFQGKGFGHIILKYGESLLKNKKAKIVWCNAREVAVNFYKKSNYKIIGESFDVKGIGLHYTMFKQL